MAPHCIRCCQQASGSPFERLVRHSIDNGDAARSAELHRAQYLAGAACDCVELFVLC